MHSSHPLEKTVPLDILRYTPLWVWGLLAALVALGVSQMRTRRVSRVRLMALPAVLMLLGLFSTATAFREPLPALAAWSAALALGAFAGWHLLRPAATWDPASRKLLLPGSVLPLALILAIFLLRYAGTVALVMHPAWRSSLAVALPLSAAFGSLSGLFAGRAFGLAAQAR